MALPVLILSVGIAMEAIRLSYKNATARKIRQSPHHAYWLIRTAGRRTSAISFGPRYSTAT